MMRAGKQLFLKLENKIGLTWKLIIHILWIVVAIGAILTWYAINKEKALLVDELRLRHTAQANYWIQNNLISLISPDPQELQNLVRELRSSSDVAYVVLYDAEGKIIAVSGKGAPHATGINLRVQGVRNLLEPEFEQILAPGGQLYELSIPILLPQGPNAGREASLSAVTELLPTKPQRQSQPEILGVVHLGIWGESIDAKMDAIRDESVTLAAVIVGFALMLTYILTQRTTKPIKKVAQQATAIAKGDFSKTEELLVIRSVDEVGDLARNFYDMSVRLKESKEDLEKFNRELEEKVRERTKDLERANRQLEEANKKLMEVDELKSTFLSTVSHELRTPLTSIKAFAEILLDNQGEDIGTHLRFLNIINNESERLSRLISDLLDLSKIESGVIKWKMEAQDLQEIVDRSLESISSLANKKGIVIATNFPATIPLIYGDQDKLVQVITNLLSNAVKFTEEGGNIDIGAKTVKKVGGLYLETDSNEGRTADFLQVSVRDNGIGISSEHVTRIFEKFQQVDSTATRQRGGGTGLGLAICKEIVEHHKGDIWVESEAEKGSTFYFTALLAHSQSGATFETGIQPAVTTTTSDRTTQPIVTTPGIKERSSRRKILIVDDEPNIREFLKYELLNEGYEVIEAAGGEETIDLARRERPDVITLDILMPGIDGFDILSILHHDKETRHIPVIVVSIVDDKEKGFRLGAVDYLGKPIDRKGFLESIRRILRQVNGERQQEVLIVDDDKSLVEALENILVNEDFKVVAAFDGETGIEQALKIKPDLIVLDLKLPGIDGYEVVRGLKAMEATKSTPIVVITASDLGGGKTKSLALGASEYMTKPFSKEKFVEILKKILAETKSGGGQTDA